jgi:RNA polymerase sigma factor (sigma-70 family)
MTRQDVDLQLIENILKENDVRNIKKYSERELYNYYCEYLTKYISCKWSQYITTIEDDVSEILIKIFNNLTTYDSKKSKFKTWVLSIAKNHMKDKTKLSWTLTTASTSNSTLIIDYDSFTTHNASNVEFTTTSGVFLTNSAANTVVNCSETESFENRQALNVVMDTLEPEDSTMLNMKYKDGYKYNEIALEHQSDEQKVSNRVAYIRSKLKKMGDI